MDMMKKLVIFDLDGTLLNTIADLGNACNYALMKSGFTGHPASAYNYMVGNGVRKLLERAEPAASPDMIDEMLLKFREYYDEHCTDQTVPYPGIEGMLDDMVASGISVAVTSNKYQLAVEKIIKYYFPNIPFVAVEGEVADRPRKPDPSIVFSVLSKSPCPKKNVLYVGDSAVDMETARRACIDSVGVTWGFRPASELKAACADYIVSSPMEILDIALGRYNPSSISN